MKLDRLVNIIGGYESDTFSANTEVLTPAEEVKIAERLFDRFCTVVEEGGTFTCDGTVLAELLEEIRTDE